MGRAIAARRFGKRIEDIFDGFVNMNILPARKILLAGGIVLLAGCAVEPGMRMNLSAADPDRAYAVSGPAAASIPELFEINTDTLNQLEAKQRAAANIKAETKLTRAGEQPYEYKIGPYDILRITVWDHPELNTPSVLSSAPSQSSVAVVGGGAANGSDYGRLVDGNGTMFYPYVGLIHVAGETPLQVRQIIQDSLSRVIKDPQLEVVVASFRSNKVYVSGEVKTPSIFPLTDQPMRVSDAILGAGGFIGDSAEDRATLTRKGVTYPIDLYAMFHKGDHSQDVLLQNGDVLNVPNNRSDKIFMMGEVSKQASLPILEGKYSLAEALSDAGGPNQTTSKPSQIYVMRRGDDGRVHIYHLNARSPDELVVADRFRMKPRDVIYVDAAAVTRWSRVLNQLLPSASFIDTAAVTAKQ